MDRKGSTILLLLMLAVTGTFGDTCSGNIRAPCGNEPEKLNRQRCESFGSCCWDDNLDDIKCFVDVRKLQRNPQKLQNQKRAFDIKAMKQAPAKPKTADAVTKPIQEAAKKLDPKLELGVDTAKIKKVGERSLSFGGGAFGGGAFGGGGFPSILGQLSGFQFPSCPVKVKACHRVPCGYNAYQGAESCYRNPRCCYDQSLAFYRQIFGQNFLGNTPACYYGPTSRTWLYVTSLFQPWNPWLTTFVIDIFEDLFDNALLNFQGQAVCKISGSLGGRCGADDITKIECSMLGCCWNSNKCYYPDSRFLQYFDVRETFPALYTNNPSETVCRANPFDFGPSAYNRIPCAYGSAPDSITDIFGWCPLDRCCLNVFGLKGSSSLSSLLLLSQVGGGGGFPGLGGGFPGVGGGFPGVGGGFPGIGGGFPGIGGGFPGSSGLSGLIGLSGLSGLGGLSGLNNITALFCPFTFVQLLGSGFPDLSEAVEGCCDIPVCYHKKRLVGGGPIQPPRPPTQPPILPPVQPQASWSAFENCQAQCNQQGTRYRQCVYYNSNNQPAPSHLCPGLNYESCQGPPCPTQRVCRDPYRQTTACSRPCGEGSATFVGTCYANNSPQPENQCPGGCQTQRPCNNNACQQGTWGAPWTPLSQCSAECGPGSQYARGTCLVGGQQASSSQCQGNSDQTRPCNKGPCQTHRYGEWASHGPCGATCGRYGLQEYKRTCYRGQTPLADAQPCQFLGKDRELRSCLQRDCTPTKQYYWLLGNWSPCRDQYGQFCAQPRTRTRECYEQVGLSYQKVIPQSSCPGNKVETKQCVTQECLSEG